MTKSNKFQFPTFKFVRCVSDVAYNFDRLKTKFSCCVNMSLRVPAFMLPWLLQAIDENVD